MTKPKTKIDALIHSKARPPPPLRQNRESGMVNAKKEMVNNCISRNFFPGIAKRARAPRKREDGHQVEENERRQTYQDARPGASWCGHEKPPALAPSLALSAEALPEHGSLRNRQAHIEAQEHQVRRSARKTEAASRKRRTVVGEPP